jgi:uncharacterized repeat protein (TIGR03803 family)
MLVGRSRTYSLPKKRKLGTALAVAEALEGRVLLSAMNPGVKSSPLLAKLSGEIAKTTFIDLGAVGKSSGLVASANSVASVNSSVSPDNLSAPYTPANIEDAYGENLIEFGSTTGTGSGQTIAIIDAYNDPDILTDANTFSTKYGLTDFNGSGEPTLKVLNETGGTSLTGVPNATPGNWDVEESLDVEYAHTMAPDANIILFEANSDDLSDLFTAVGTAADESGVSVVSMSWGGAEFSGETSEDSIFTTPSGHQNVLFVGSAGDSGDIPQYPSESPNVISVGGTSLTINSNGTYNSESAWSDGGGGPSAYESQPSYQVARVNDLSTTARLDPDVSADANPSTGVYVIDSYYAPGDLLEVGGTSLAAPMWAGLMAQVDQGRVINGLSTLTGAQALSALYSASPSYFHDITSGSNGESTLVGYDMATGLGSPIANLLVPALAGSATGPKLAIATQPPSSITAGGSISPILVDVENANGTVNTTATNSVTLSVYYGPSGSSIVGTTTVSAVNGVATFSGLSLDTAGLYTLEASGTSLYTALTSGITVKVGTAKALVFTTQPNNDPYGVTISPSVTVAVEDAFGNIVTSGSSTNIVLSLTGSPSGVTLSGTLTGGTSSGVATYGNLSINKPGTYTLTAKDSSLSLTTTSNSFITTTAEQLVFNQEPVSGITGTAISPAVTVDVEDQFGNLVTGDTSTVTVAIGSGTAGALTGTLSAAASGGVATLSNLIFTSPGTFTITATDGSLTSATSTSFPITAIPAKLVIESAPPSTANVGAAIPISVEITDQYGNVVTGATGSVVLAVDTGPTGGTLGGLLTVAPSAGVATFTSPWLNEAGAYTLEATSGSLSAAITGTITVTGSYGLNELASFNGSSNGDEPLSEPSFDGSGNLYGTTQTGGASGDGTIFEVAKGTGTITTLASFNGTDGAYPQSGVTFDSSGDMYGLTGGGGGDEDGTVWEIVAGSSTLTTLASFTGTNGEEPLGNLIMDSSGNLYGVCTEGGMDTVGCIFEIAKGSSAITDLASFTGGNGEYPNGGLVMDSSGDLFGTAFDGGGFNDGDVFELAKGSSTITALASFNGSNGLESESGLAIDSSGDLFGTTANSSNSSEATVFEVAKGSSTITTLVTFVANSFPGSLVVDGNGNLFGTTESSSSSPNLGTAFEIVKGSTTATTLVTFDGVNGALPNGLAMDGSGNLWGFTEEGGNTSFSTSSPQYGEAFELQAPHMVFTQQPTSAESGAVISPTVTVTLENPYGGVITGDNSTINLSINSGSGTLGGTESVALSGGVATFSTLSASGSGALTIRAQYGTNSNVTVVSNSFTVTAAPQVTNVTVDGSAWSSTFLSYLSSLSSANVNGYSIPVGSSAQLNTLPWDNLNQINITFSENVTVAEGSLQLFGVNVPTYSFSGFSYSSSTDTATWTLSSAITADKLAIDLSGSVENSLGMELNGAWTDGTSTYPSGNGTAGTAFLFDFNVLPGDVNQSGAVNILDAAATLNLAGTSTSTSGYSIFMDVTGSGAINILDAAQVLNLAGTSLPSETPAIVVVAGNASPTVLVLAQSANQSNSVLD